MNSKKCIKNQQWRRLKFILRMGTGRQHCTDVKFDTMQLHRVPLKTSKIIFFGQNFVKSPPNLTIFWQKDGQRNRIAHLLSISPDLYQRPLPC